MNIQNRDNISYKAALTASMKKDYTLTVKSAKKLLGIDNGLSLLKIHSGSMPYLPMFDTGIGKLNSRIAVDFIKFMKLYTDVNAVKVFPSGQTTKNWGHYYCPYLKTAVTFGEENINLNNIIENKDYYGNILDYKDIKVLKDDKKNPYAINYEQELGLDENYPILGPLKTAYNNYKAGLSTPKLEQDFNNYKQQPIVNSTYTRLALYPFIHKKEKNLFKNFEYSPQNQAKFENYKKQYKDEIDFFHFRQFLAQKEHDEAKSKINQTGTDLFGDCLIGFAPQEVWAHPDAFINKTCIGLYDWGLPALKFKEILNNSSEANKVFDEKLSFFLKNYDGIRFDVGWCYAIAQVGKKGKEPEHIDMKRSLYDYIEKRAKDIKGEDFNTKKLIYEMDGFEKMFTGWENKKPKPIANIKNIVNVLTTEYEYSNGIGWGSPEFFLKTGITEDELIMGTNNHDGANLRALAEQTQTKYTQLVKDNSTVLSKIFKIPKQKLINNPAEFIKAKFAQLYTIKNQFLFFTDVLGSRHDMDSQNLYPGNFRFRVNEDFERQYHTALQQGFGFNLPEVLKMVIKAKSLDKENPELYSKLDYYAKYLRKKGPKTEQEAKNFAK